MGQLRGGLPAAGSAVKVKSPIPVPHWSTWDDDGNRVSNSVKKRLQQQFFLGDRRISARMVYVTSESQRDRLKSKGHVKVEVRDSAGSTIVVLAPAEQIVAA